jgi:hypothetical protein
VQRAAAVEQEDAAAQQQQEEEEGAIGACGVKGATGWAHLLRALLLAVDGRVTLLLTAAPEEEEEEEEEEEAAEEKSIQEELVWLITHSSAAPCVESTAGAPSLADSSVRGDKGAGGGGGWGEGEGGGSALH